MLVARLVDGLPAAVESGLDSPAGKGVLGSLAGIGAVLVGQELVGAAREVVRWELYRRYEEYLLARVMRAILSASRLELFEDPAAAALADRAVRIARLEPGDLVDGLTTKLAAQAQGIAAAFLVAMVWPAAALVLLVAWLVAGNRMRTSYQRTDLEWVEPLRRAGYLEQLGLLPEWAKELRIFGLVDWLADRYGKQWGLVLAELWKARRIDQRTMTVLLGVVVVSNVVVLAWAARSAADGALGLGALTVLAQGMFGMAFLAEQAGDNLIAYGASRIPEVHALERNIAAQPPAASGNRSANGLPVREIRLDDVRFAYPGKETRVFDGLTLRIQAGRSLAVVGLNGAGKTTLVKLLAGLEVPQAGRITVDGIDLAELDPASWRGTVAAIFQDFVRYELPARDNIGFGAVDRLPEPDADERITTAAERAGAGDVLADLPMGLDTPLSRRFAGGVDLSGGQWQRIALARAIVAVESGARVLVLDEPTAQLDVRAEASVYDRFLELTAGLTTIVISHRFSTVRRADRIVVLDAGRISEDGSHDELVTAGGPYARLFRKQAMRYEDTRDE